jgi:hypothetical protein
MAYSYHIAEGEGFLLHYPLFGETMRSTPLLSTLVQVGFLLSSIDCVSWCFICFTVFHGVSWCFVFWTCLNNFSSSRLQEHCTCENFSSGVPVDVLITYALHYFSGANPVCSTPSWFTLSLAHRGEENCGGACQHGEWGQWREWTDCSSTCGDAYRFRRRRRQRRLGGAGTAVGPRIPGETNWLRGSEPRATNQQGIKKIWLMTNGCKSVPNHVCSGLLNL